MKQFWDDRYGQEEFIYGTEPNEYLKEVLYHIDNKGHILFPCEGEGRNAVFAAQLGWQVSCFDFSSEAKKKAMRLAGSKNVSLDYIVSEVESFDFGQHQFDAIAFIFAHFHPNIRATIHQKASDALKPGGYIIIEAFNPKQMTYSSGGPKDVEMLYTIDLLKSDFDTLNIEILEEKKVFLHEGAYHNGEAEIIRMLGKKI